MSDTRSFGRSTVIVRPTAGPEEPEDHERPDTRQRGRRRRARVTHETAIPELAPLKEEQRNGASKGSAPSDQVDGSPIGPTVEADERKPATQSGYPDWVTAGRPIKPGPRLLLWWLYTRLRLYRLSWIPQPRPYGLYAARIPEMSRWLVEARQQSMAIVAVVTAKGGAAKTTTATWLAGVLMRIIKLAVAVFDTDGGGGKVAKRFNLDSSKTLSSDKAVDMIVNGAETETGAWAPTYEDFVTRVSADEATGVMVFHCPAGTNIAQNKLEEALGEVKTGFHTLIVDCGPGFGVAATQGAVKVSTVRVLPARFYSEDDLDDIKETLDHPAYGLRDNIDSVVISVSGARWRQYNTRNQYLLAERFGVKPEQVVLRPYSSYQEKTRHVRIPMLSPKALYAETRLAEAVALAAIAYNGQHPVPVLPGEVQSTTAVHAPDDTLSSSTQTQEV